MPRRYRVTRTTRHELGASSLGAKKSHSHWRVRIVGLGFVLVLLIIIARIFSLMVSNHHVYTALASGTHEIYAQLFPERGIIYLENREGDRFPLALNQDKFLVYADTRGYHDSHTPVEVADALTEFFGYTPERREVILAQLQKENDPYEQIERSVDRETRDKLLELQLPGVHFITFRERYYPEGMFASHILGFVGKTESGENIGRYGLEGYWNKEISGTSGFLEGVRSAKGAWIPLAGRSLERAENGVNMVLTIDRTIQYEACAQLRRSVELYEAESGALVIMDPKTGSITAMCSVPEFDPNQYNRVASVRAYNNLTIFEPYEPGSVFKPIAIAAAINEEIMTPYDYFYDSGSVDANCLRPIRNADLRAYGDQTITGVLENSINTGMVHVVQALGKQAFRSYVEQFGFGVKTGIELDTESSGTVESLYRNRADRVDCYTATASFGQGITATPLQLASAFSAIANGGMLMKPYIVKRIEHVNGKVDDIQPIEIRRVLDKRAASLVSGMMVRVIDNGQATLAKVPGYYVAGKTGTAQIAGPGGYTSETNHSFVGFGPVDDPRFVMVIRLEKPRVAYSSTTAAPTFGTIAKYLMSYYHIPTER